MQMADVLKSAQQKGDVGWCTLEWGAWPESLQQEDWLYKWAAHGEH